MRLTLRAVRDDAIYACNQRDEILRFAELPLLLPLFYAPASVAGATDIVDYNTKPRAAAALARIFLVKVGMPAAARRLML